MHNKFEISGFNIYSTQTLEYMIINATHGTLLITHHRIIINAKL